jgi:uncharacterized membrane protein YhaH (DUF805 family)
MNQFTIMMEYYISVLKKYAIFEGRARRKEFWLFLLASLIVSIGIAIIDGIVGGRGMLGNLYSLAILIPSLAVGARRLHDINKSGWWQLIALIPIVGWIILIVWFATDGTPGDNRFGNNPKGTVAFVAPTNDSTPQA